jgi:hypothetical protein
VTVVRKFLISYSTISKQGATGMGRGFAFMRRKGLPTEEVILAWEKQLCDQDGHARVGIHAFQEVGQ